MAETPTQEAGGQARLGGILSAGMVRMAGMAMTLMLNFGIMRLLGAEGYGVYIFGMSVGLLASIVGRFGVERVVIRLLVPASAEDDYDLIKGIIIWACVIAFAITAVIAVGLLGISGFKEVYRDVLIVAAPIALAVTLMMVCQGYLRATASTALAIAPEFVARPLFAILLSLAAWLIAGKDGLTPSLLLTMYFGGTLIAALIAVVLVVRRLPVSKLKAATPQYHSRDWFCVAGPIYLNNIMLLTQPQLVIVIAGLVLSEAEVGWVGFAIRVAATVSIPLAVVGLYAAPNTVRRYKMGDIKGLQRDLTLYCRVTAATGLVAAAVLSGALFLGAVGLLDASFLGAEPLVMVFVLGQFLTALTGPVGAVLTMTNSERAAAWIAAISLAALVLIGLIGGQLFGVYGIALASVVAVTYRSAANFTVARRNLGVWALPFGAGLQKTGTG